MKLFASFSEAIRAANGVFAQSFFGPEARGLLNKDRGKFCAIEAGLKAMGTRRLDRTYIDKTIDAYPYLNDASAACPRCQAEDRLINLLWRLNDTHQLSFAQISDWLETEEEKLGYVTVIEAVSVVATSLAEQVR